jgi:phosphodiesterase/alkaline phosphatase D-like protein
VGAVMLFFCSGFYSCSSSKKLAEGEFQPGVEWSLAGAVTSSSAVISFGSQVDGNILLEMYNKKLNIKEQSHKIKLNKKNGFVYKQSLQQLKPDTEYEYTISTGSNKRKSVKGSFKTFPEGVFSFKIALGACAETGSESRVFTEIKNQDPLFYLQLGDIHYGDIGANCVNSFDSVYQKVFTSSTQSALYQRVPLAYMWDDHDYGPNNSGLDNPCRREAIESYKKYIPHYPLAFNDTEGPVSQKFEVGRIVFVLTDLRSQKDKPVYNQCERTKAGSNFGTEDHLLWFFDVLKQAKSEGKAVAWVNSIPWINMPGGPNYKCNEVDNWGGYPEERQVIANFIKENSIPVFILSGDAHMIAIDDGTNSDYATGKGAPIKVFQAGALDRPGSYKGGPYSHGYKASGGQYGVMDVIDIGGEDIYIQWTAYDVNGFRVTNQENRRIEYRFRVPLSQF